LTDIAKLAVKSKFEKCNSDTLQHVKTQARQIEKKVLLFYITNKPVDGLVNFCLVLLCSKNYYDVCPCLRWHLCTECSTL